ncbi:MAG TPA: methyltransferase domain-containing protein [Streptosporangiaceae bacterium]|nr:methyltransferase domain-containing protein [Streptosporangiaceae bacterium]
MSDGYAARHLAESFTYPGVVQAYQYRPPYPTEVFDRLLGLISDQPRHVLDLGAGEGAIARPLASRVDRVDAVDPSTAMIEAGRQRPGGTAPNLRWILGTAESAEFDGPYALVTAGASLHWMLPGPTTSRLAQVMTAGAYLVVLGHGHRDVPWQEPLDDVIRRHSRHPSYDTTYSPEDELATAGLFEIAGQVKTAPVPFRQSVQHYVEYLHSTSSLARELMPGQEADDFDRAVTEVLRPYASDGELTTTVVAKLTWGRISSRAAS